jgi:NADPH-dependent curcumin reductase CurA
VLVVSAASGAVGSVVGQLGKIAGCRVVGIAGGKAKCDYVLNELGFDAVVDYKAGKFDEDLRAAVPKGVDIYFDNVGGPILDTMLGRMRVFSRIVVCGLISEYNATEPYGYKRLRSVLVNRIKMQGMIVFDWQARYGEGIKGLADASRRREAQSTASPWSRDRQRAQGLHRLLKGENFGKQLVKF